MKIRTKLIIFFGTFLLVIAVGISFYTENVVAGVFKKQATNNLRIIAEQSESAYLSFLGSMKVRVLDWTSDNTIRETTKAILATKEGSPERVRLAEEFGTYVSKKKMPFDKTIFLAHLLDKNGIVIASTRPKDIGKDENNEVSAGRKMHDFKSTINSKFGEVFFGTIVLNGDEHPEPTLNVTARIFDVPKSGDPKPLDAVLLVYYSNVAEIAEVLGSGTSVYAGLPTTTGRKTNKALLEGYQTSDLYLVNNERYLVTPSRTIKNVTVKQKADTLPVRECLENGNEVSGEYDNYQGVRVIGASMCFQKEGTIVLVEIQKDEIFAPLTTLNRSTATGGAIALVLGILIIILIIQRPLADINDAVLVARRVAKGDLSATIKVRTNDELGYLATSFNTMISSVSDNQKYLREAKRAAEKKQAEDEALLESLGEGMVAADAHGNIIAINHMAETMLGWKSSEIIGKKVVDVWEMLDENRKEIPPEKRPTTIATEGVTTVSSTGLYGVRNDGYFPVALTATPVILEGKVIGSVTIFRDITKEKEIEKTRGDLLSLASHQLRTPLSGTKWLIETLKRGLQGPLTPGQTEYLDEIYKINERMTSLVHDMLGVLSMEGDVSIAKKEDVPTKIVLETVLETLHGAAKSKEMVIKISGDVNYTVKTDPLLLRNIIESFVSNAINYSNEGSEVIVSVNPRTQQGSESGDLGPELVFAVKDSGIGIPKDEQRQIFDRFYRASNAKVFDTRGSGLGLYIAAMLAKKMGARISFESEVGKGSVFYLHVPYDKREK